MVSNEGHVEFFTTILKDKSEIAIPAAFKELIAEFSYSEAAVHVRLAVSLDQITERQKTFNSVALRNLP